MSLLLLIKIRHTVITVDRWIEAEMLTADMSQVNSGHQLPDRNRKKDQSIAKDNLLQSGGLKHLTGNLNPGNALLSAGRSNLKDLLFVRGSPLLHSGRK